MSTPIATLDREDLRATFAAVLELDAADVADDAHLIDDLGADSLAALEVVVVLEKRYGIRLSESEMAEIVTLDRGYALLSAKVAAR
jgi:acyl carrier protein